MYLFGGSDGRVLLRDLWLLAVGARGLEADDCAWAPVEAAGAAPTGRMGHSLAHIPAARSLLSFGGFVKGVRGGYSAQIWLLSLDTLAWSEPRVRAPPGAPLVGRLGCASCVIRGRMLVVGGSSNGKVIDEALAFNVLEEGGEVSIARLPSSGDARAHAAALVAPPFAIILGGATEAAALPIVVLDSRDWHWLPREQVPEVRVAGLSTRAKLTLTPVDGGAGNEHMCLIWGGDMREPDGPPPPLVLRIGGTALSVGDFDDATAADAAPDGSRAVSSINRRLLQQVERVAKEDAERGLASPALSSPSMPAVSPSAPREGSSVCVPGPRTPGPVAMEGASETPGLAEAPGLTETPGLTEVPGLTNTPGLTETSGLVEMPGLAEMPGVTDASHLPQTTAGLEARQIGYPQFASVPPRPPVRRKPSETSPAAEATAGGEQRLLRKPALPAEARARAPRRLRDVVTQHKLGARPRSRAVPAESGEGIDASAEATTGTSSEVSKQPDVMSIVSSAISALGWRPSKREEQQQPREEPQPGEEAERAQQEASLRQPPAQQPPAPREVPTSPPPQKASASDSKELRGSSSAAVGVSYARGGVVRGLAASPRAAPSQPPQLAPRNPPSKPSIEPPCQQDAAAQASLDGLLTRPRTIDRWVQCDDSELPRLRNEVAALTRRAQTAEAVAAELQTALAHKAAENKAMQGEVGRHQELVALVADLESALAESEARASQGEELVRKMREYIVTLG